MHDALDRSLEPAPATPPGGIFRSAPLLGILLAVIAVVLGVAPAMAQDLRVAHGRTVIDSGAEFSFGGNELGSAAVRNFTVTNLSSSIVDLSGVTITGDAFTGKLKKTMLLPGRRTSLVVRMPTGAPGDLSASIIFPSPDGGDPLFQFDVSGAVLEPRAKLEFFNGPEPVMDGDGVSFGSTLVGHNVTKAFTIRNSGNLPLTLSNIVLTSNTGFTVLSQPAGSVKPGGSTKFSLRMIASASGSPQANARLDTNDPEAPAVLLSLDGSVAIAGPEVQVRSGGVNINSGATISFGHVNAADVKPLALTIRNTGTSTLTLGTVSSTSIGFPIAIQPDSSVPPGGSTLCFFTFDSNNGNATGTISFTTNDPDEGVFSFIATGEADPVPDVEVRSDLGANVANGSTFELGDIGVNSPVFRVFTMKNVGGLPLTFSGFGLLQPGFDFALVLPAAGPIAPGGSRTFTLSLLPPGPGPLSATVRFTNNDPNEDPFEFIVTARGVIGGVIPPRPAPRPLLSLSHDGVRLARGGVLDFNTTSVGAPLTRTFTITNTGVGALSLGKVAIAGPGFSLVSLPEDSVPAGAGTTFSLRLDAARSGRSAAVVLIPSNDAERPDPFLLMVAGTVEGKR